MRTKHGSVCTVPTGENASDVGGRGRGRLREIPHVGGTVGQMLGSAKGSYGRRGRRQNADGVTVAAALAMISAGMTVAITLAMIPAGFAVVVLIVLEGRGRMAGAIAIAIAIGDAISSAVHANQEHGQDHR